MQRAKWFVPSLALAFVVTGAQLGCLVEQVKRTGPSAAKASLPDCQVMVVGTIHSRHMVNKNYPLQVLSALLDRWKPDLVLVEIRPKAFDKGHLEDGPFEMTYVTALAKQRHIRVVPIDWFRESDIQPPSARDMAAEKKAMAAVASLFQSMHGVPGFYQVHDRQFTRAMLQALNARNRFLHGTPVWNRRQAWMEFQAAQAIWQYRPKRVALFVGFQHRPEIQAYLEQLGARVVDPIALFQSTGFSMKALARRPIPESVLALWRQGLARLRARAAKATGFLHCSLLNKARYFQVATVQGGRCCVQPKSLRVACRPVGSTPTKTPSHPAMQTTPGNAAGTQGQGTAGPGSNQAQNTSSGSGAGGEPAGAPSSAQKPGSQPARDARPGTQPKSEPSSSPTGDHGAAAPKHP